MSHRLMKIEKELNVVVVVIRNDEGQYFIHHRRSDKHICPDLYALGIGGRVESGEDIDCAASRELKEEANLNKPIKFLFSMKMDHIREGETVNVFELYYNDEIKNCDKEWQWSGWMTETEIDQLIENEKLCLDTAEYYKKYKILKSNN